MPVPSLALSSDSHVFEPADLWQTRIDSAFRERAPRRVLPAFPSWELQRPRMKPDYLSGMTI